jgi:hypothetical protein
MLVKTFKIVMLAITVAILSSCSTEDEVFEEQGPKSSISTALREQMMQSTSSDSTMAAFQSQINWYQNFNPATCGVDAMVLAFELFDEEGESLNVISIFAWEAEFGTLESAIDQQLDFYTEEFQQEVTIVFVSGLLVKLSDTSDDVEVAEVDSFTLFLDYFDNCQSSSVTFQLYDGTAFNWNLLEVPAPEEDVVFPQAPCLSLVFPLQILVATDNPNEQAFVVTVTESEFLNYLGDDVPNLTFIDFVYPLTVSSNGTQFIVNNLEQLELLFEQQCD